MSNRTVIVNADDFGQSAGVNRGIVQAFEKGIVTSTSLMVRWPCATEAAEYARWHPELGVGLHLDFGEWAYRDGQWARLYQVVDENDPVEVAGEIERQWSAFISLMGRIPTHIDSHQHAHRNEPARTQVMDLASRFDIPVRDLTPAIRYCGRFYGQGENGTPYPEWLSLEGLLEILSTLEVGATEIGCHPAAVADLDTMYRTERLTELATLCDDRIGKAIREMGIELRSFADWRSFADACE